MTKKHKGAFLKGEPDVLNAMTQRPAKWRERPTCMAMALSSPGF
jgi:hypothetical protein